MEVFERSLGGWAIATGALHVVGIVMNGNKLVAMGQHLHKGVFEVDKSTSGFHIL